MRTLFAATVALTAWSSTAALAEPAGPVELTDAQMDRVTAGDFVRIGSGRLIDRIITELVLAGRSGGNRVANPGVNVSFVPLDLDDVQNLF